MKPDPFRHSTAGRPIRHPNGYWAFLPNPLPPAIEWTSELVNILSAADRSLGELAGLGHSLANPDLLIKPFIRREAVLSSQIEGTRASLADLYLYETGQPALFELPDDVREVDNYVTALTFGLNRLTELPLSLRLIRELHAKLLQGVRGEQWTPGEFRRSQNWIGPAGCTLATAHYVPPPVDEMHTALNDLERYLHTDDDMPPLVRLALIHYQFEAIHPFLDGNGRVGRLLNNLLLYAWDLLPQPLLYLSAYFHANRPAYYDGLMLVSQKGAWHHWLLFFLEGVQLQADDSVARINALLGLQAAYRNLFQSSRASARLLQAVDALFEQPLFTINQLAKRLDVSYAAAHRYTVQMEAHAIIEELTNRDRQRLFAATAVLDAVR